MTYEELADEYDRLADEQTAEDTHQRECVLRWREQAERLREAAVARDHNAGLREQAEASIAATRSIAAVEPWERLRQWCTEDPASRAVTLLADGLTSSALNEKNGASRLVGAPNARDLCRRLGLKLEGE